MTAAVRRQLAAHSANVAPVTRKPTKATPLSSSPNEGHSAAEYARIQTARRAAVGYGYRADTNTTFGVPVYVRTYRLLHEAEAARLDAVFSEITGTTPTP